MMDEQSPAKSKNFLKRPLLIILLAAAFSVLIVLALITVYSSDDYWYSTFMTHGAAAYLRMMKDHYLTFNGRTFVHFVVQLVLHCGNGLFALLLAGCCALIPTAVYGMEKGKDGGIDGLLLCMLLFLSGVFLLPRNLVVEGMLWVSGSCNYTLPTAMVAGLTLLLRRFTDREERRFYPRDLLLWGCCFLCGATTEQMGAAAVGVAALFVLKNLFLKRKRIWVSLGAAVCACCGLLTIFLSPATRQRMMKETVTDITVNTGFVQHMRYQLGSQTETFSQSPFLIAVFAALFFFTGWLLLRRKGLPKWLGGVWLALSAASLILLRTQQGDRLLLAYAAVLGLTALQTLIWLACGHEGMAFILLAGLGSIGVILLTNSGGSRTFLPFCLCLLAVLAPAVMLLLEELPSATARGGVALCLTLFSFAVIGAQLPGYWYNYRLDRINQQSVSRAGETGEIYYRMDYDESYTHMKPYDDGYFFLKWVDSIGVDPSVCRINFCSGVLPGIYVAGERAQLLAPQLGSGETYLLIPAQPPVSRPDSGGTYLLPVRYIVESLGGSLEARDYGGEEFLIRLGGREYSYAARGAGVTVQWQEGDTVRSIEGERLQKYAMTFISEEIFSEAFGLRISHRDGDIYVDMP